MGHTRLGDPPKSLKWDQVVDLVVDAAVPGSPADRISDIAKASLDAAEAGIQHAIADEGLRHTIFTLMQIVLAARHDDWQLRLSDLGIRVPSDGGVLDLTGAVQDALDDHIFARGKATDISEMAQQAAGEALASLTKPTGDALFAGADRKQLAQALRELSTKNGFARLGQRFFGRFMARFLNFHLSRITAGAVGGKQMSGVGEAARFNEALTWHCEQSARIVRDFCGSWYSKTQYEGGIDAGNTARFMAVALKKLRNEMQRQREGL